VWLKGTTECESPLIGPHFDLPCIYYDYRLDERVRRSYRDKKGRRRTRYVWENREASSDATGFFLRDGDHTIHVEGSDAQFRHCANEVSRIGTWRHTLNYYPHPSEVNVVGSVSEGKKRLEAYANIPLIVTTKSREEYVKDAERQELWMRRIGFPVFWAGFAGLLCFFFDRLLSPVPAVSSFPGNITILAAISATIVVTLYWCIFKYNSMVRYRNRIENGWHQIDVDLTMRYDLIPRLVNSVKGAMKHERQLLERLIRLRDQASASRGNALDLESEVATSVDQTIARVESYPDLTAQGPTFKLTRQLRAIEEKISHGRLIFNESVREYNDVIQTYPQALIANQFGFEDHAFFSIPDEKKQMPDIEFTNPDKL
jgi:LemA protein